MANEQSVHFPKCGIIQYLHTVNRIKSVGQGGTGHRNKNRLDMTSWFNNSVSWARGAPPVGTLWTLSGCSPSGDTCSQLPLGMSTVSAQLAETTCAHDLTATCGWDQCVVGTNVWLGIMRQTPLRGVGCTLTCLVKGASRERHLRLVFPNNNCPWSSFTLWGHESRCLCFSFSL
jgi:hypothetical protein